MKIWVDADACPVVIKEILFKASRRTRTPMTLVANHHLQVPALSWINFLQVAPGFDVADNEIIKRMNAGDLVITGDIPLAAEVVEQKGYALNPRGTFYTVENIRQHLNTRDFMDSLRSSGVQTGGPSAMGANERKDFANQLDQFLQRNASS